MGNEYSYRTIQKFIILLSLVLFFLIFHNVQRNHLTDVHYTEDLIISHCTEDLNWVFDFIDKYDNIFIYTKCKKELQNFNNKKVTIKELPNSGQEGETYLYHIINRWDNLANYNVFMTGNPLHKKREQVLNEIKKSEHKNSFHVDDDIQYDFSMDSYDMTDNKSMNIGFIKSKYKNFGDFVLQIFGEKYYNDLKKFNKKC